MIKKGERKERVYNPFYSCRCSAFYHFTQNLQIFPLSPLPHGTPYKLRYRRQFVPKLSVLIFKLACYGPHEPCLSYKKLIVKQPKRKASK